MPQEKLDLGGRVNFSVIGAQKSGTTALRHFLSQHPDLGLTKNEPHYFDQKWKKDGPEIYAAYHSLFTPQALAKIAGDVTPIYLYMDGCLERMKQYNPEMRIIVLLRDPVERTYSQWVMQREKGEESRSFLHALWNEFKVYRSTGQHLLFSYVQRGFYDRQLEHLFSLFPPEQCLIIKTKELEMQHEQTLARVLKFLGVEPSNIPPRARVHSREYKPLPFTTRLLLRCIFFFETRKLERRLGWKPSEWRK